MKKIALMTLYNPKKTIIDNIQRIINQVDILVLCDNSKNDNKEIINQLDNKKIMYIWFNQNLGLSKAFNKILKSTFIKWEEEDYIIFFDQDSKIELNHIDKIIEEFENINKIKNDVGCVGPIYFNLNNNTLMIPKSKERITKNSYRVKSVITSSMVTKYKNLLVVNFFNENIFLDLVDWDLCWRFINHSMSCYTTSVSIINHSLGEGEKKIGPLRFRISQPFRIYYQTRDGLNLLFEKYTPFKYRIRFIYMISIRPLLYFLFLPEKRMRLKYFRMGVKDFFLNKNGELQ